MVAAINTLASTSSASVVEGIRYVIGTHGVAELDHAQAGQGVALNRRHGPERFAKCLVDERTQRHAATTSFGLGFGMKLRIEIDGRSHHGASYRVNYQRRGHFWAEQGVAMLYDLSLIHI